MIVAKWLLIVLLALPLAELLVFVLVAAKIGFVWALALVLATSLAGALVLRHAGGLHIARMRVVLGADRMTALEADSAGTMTLIAGFLLLIPGFITDLAGILLLIAPVRRALGALLRRALGGKPSQSDGVVDLAPEEWQQVPDRQLPDRQSREQPH